MQIGVKLNRENNYLANLLQETFSDYPQVKLSFSYKNNDFSLETVDILVTDNITKDEIKQAKNLQILYFYYTGINHLPLDIIKERNITLINTHAHAPVVALRAVTLALALLGRVVELHEQMKQGIWYGYSGDSRWQAIINLRCGMLGMGGIGKNIVNFLKPFNVKFNTLSRYKNNEQEDFTYYDSVEEVCINSDVIFVSLPLTKETKDIIDEKILSKLPNSYIINVGRGELINEKALYDALKNRTLKGAAIDVWYQYPENKQAISPSRYPIHELDNLIMSPHCSGMAYNTNDIIADEIVRNLKAYFDNEEVINIVDLNKEY